ncbi:MAG: tetratricopeptide repeat protein [Elusimicrobiota bacterium]
MKSRRATAGLALLLAAAIYLPRLGVPFMWDDRPYLVNVAEFDRPIPLAAYVSPSYFGWTGEATWRPLATLSFALGVRAFGRRPLPLRLCMLIIHLFNSALLSLLVIGAGLGAEVGLAAASLFLMHPVHIETLMTVTFNKEILSTFGILLMLLAHQRRRPLLASGGLVFAVLPKEAGIIGLALAPLYDVTTGGWRELKTRWKDHALYCATAALYLYARFGPMKGPAGSEANLSAALPWTERLYYAAKGFVSSLRVLLFPWKLRIDYFALPASSSFLYFFWLLAAAAFVVLAFFLARRAADKERALSFFILWPLPALFLTSNLLPTAVLSLRLMAERWLYLPAAGFCVALAFVFRRRPAALFLVMMSWGVLGLLRSQDWASEPRLWESLVRVYPWSSKAREGLGDALFRAGRTEDAESSFQAALEVRENREDLVLAHYVPYAPPGTIGWESASLERGLGLCRLRLGDETGGEEYFVTSAELQPGDVFTRRVLAYLSAKKGDFTAARSWLDQGFALDSHDSFLLKLKPDIERRRLTFQARFD